MEKILVVDDEKSLREVMSIMLKRAGYDVTEASDGEQAIGQVNKEIYDLVITDLRMPRADGMDVLKAVKTTSPETVPSSDWTLPSRPPWAVAVAVYRGWNMARELTGRPRGVERLPRAPTASAAAGAGRGSPRPPGRRGALPARSRRCCSPRRGWPPRW